jgi:hypothetical protein
MMLRGHPLFDDYEDQYYGSGYNKRSLYERRRVAAEEARRHAEIERYYRRVKELEEQDKLRERQEHMRMQRQQQEEEKEYRRRVQEAYRMRHLEEEESRRQSLASRMRGHVDNEEEDEPEQHRIFRGPDGRLYRMPVEGLTRRDEGLTRRDDEPSVIKESPCKRTNSKRAPEPERYRIIRGPDESLLYRVPASCIPRSVDFETEETSPEETSPSTNPLRTKAQRMQKPAEETNENIRRPNPLHGGTTASGAPRSAEQEKALLQKSSTKGNKQKSGKKRVTVIVEDASDSETEDEFKSVWRNRRPSPGEWIEPVEDFKSL